MVGLYQDSRAALVVRYPIVLFLRVVYCRSITPPFCRFENLFSCKLCYYYTRFWLKRTVFLTFTGLFCFEEGEAWTGYPTRGTLELLRNSYYVTRYPPEQGGHDDTRPAAVGL